MNGMGGKCLACLTFSLSKDTDEGNFGCKREAEEECMEEGREVTHHYIILPP